MIKKEYISKHIERIELTLDAQLNIIKIECKLKVIIEFLY